MRPAVQLVALVALAVSIASTPAQATPAALGSRVQTAVRRKGHKDVRWSIGVWDAATGERLVAVGADTPRRLASVTKLATTGAALLALGPHHALTTEARIDARAADGVVSGDLVIEGTGDPGFSTHLAPDGVTAEMQRFARQVADFGVRRIEGDLVIDTSAFSGPGRDPRWGWQPGRFDWYMAPVHAVTLADGCLDVTALPGASAGSAARLQVEPSNAVITIENELTTTASRKQHVVSFLAGRASGRLVAKGRVWSRSTGYLASLACVDPPTLFGDVLQRALSDVGVEVVGETRVLRGPPAADWPRPAERSGVVVARHETALADVVDVTNRRSQNLWAESVLRHLGLTVRGDGSAEGGCRVVRETLDLTAEEFTQVDGSGLARENVGTVGAIGSVLRRLYESEHRLVFMDSLARGGDPEGTLRKRFRGDRFDGRVLGKTGTLRDTSALAGYVLADGERVLAYAILCEGVPWRARDLQDAVVTALLDG